MLTPLPNPLFLKALLAELNKAKRRIVVMNYLAVLTDEAGRRKRADPVMMLARTLLKAMKRGVAVEVILEGSKLEENYPFYSVLKKGGADAWMDTSETFIHQKVVLIDGRVIFIGSHNLTRASLNISGEFSVVTNDRRTIESFKAEFKKFTKQRREVRSQVCRNAVSLPKGFIENVAARLFRVHAESAFDLYLLLLREDKGRARPVPIKEKEWCNALGFDPREAGWNVTSKYRRYYYKHRINRVLGLLKRFGLISIDRIRDTVTRASFGGADGSPVIGIPITYWRHGWDRALSFPAKYFWLISAVEKMSSPFRPWWRLSHKQIMARYHCDAAIRKGTLELEKFCVLEIMRARPIKRGKRYSQEAQFYRLNPFHTLP